MSLHYCARIGTKFSNLTIHVVQLALIKMEATRSPCCLRPVRVISCRHCPHVCTSSMSILFGLPVSTSQPVLINASLITSLPFRPASHIRPAWQTRQFPLQYKVWVKPSAEMSFLYGNHVQKSGLGRITENTPKYGGAVVYSMSDVPLGFGVAAQPTEFCKDLDPTAVVVLHQADVGEYLRVEDDLL